MWVSAWPETVVKTDRKRMFGGYAVKNGRPGTASRPAIDFVYQILQTEAHDKLRVSHAPLSAIDSGSSGMKEIKAQIGRGDLVSAEQTCRQALVTRPDDIAVNFFLAYILWRKGRAEAALDACRKTLSLDPGDAGLLSDLGNLLRELGAEREALDALDRSLRLRPGHPGTLYNRALLLDALGREREALDLLGAIRPQDPLYTKARYLRGTIRQDLGDMTGAETDFLACIEADPDHAGAWHALVSTRRFTRDDEIIGRLEARLARSGADRDARRRYLFALAKLNDDIGEYESASERLLEANRLVDARYDGPGIETRLQRLREHFRSSPRTTEAVQTRPYPVFIVGLPRSGTTLVETLLDRHPDVTALGELDALPRLIFDFSKPPDAAELQALGLRYLQSLPAAGRHSSLVLDKMPENFWRLGHIALMFPEAKIVHCRRDERDVALSNFFNLYATGNSFAYSIANLAHYSACHAAVMQHWILLMPAQIFRLDYDKLVTQPAECMTELLGFLGLDRTAALDAPRQQTRRIKTASNWQVRQKIYTSSIGRWKNYPRLANEFDAHYRAHAERLGQLTD